MTIRQVAANRWKAWTCSPHRSEHTLKAVELAEAGQGALHDVAEDAQAAAWAPTCRGPGGDGRPPLKG